MEFLGGDWNLLDNPEYWLETNCRIVGVAKVEGYHNVEYEIYDFIEFDPLWFDQIQIDKQFVRENASFNLRGDFAKGVMSEGARLLTMNYLWNLVMEGIHIPQPYLHIQSTYPFKNSSIFENLRDTISTKPCNNLQVFTMNSHTT